MIIVNSIANRFRFGEEGEECVLARRAVIAVILSEEKKERKPKERKVDEEKKFLLDCILAGLKSTADTFDFNIKTETEINFTAYGNQYTVKLTKHRPPKS